jgi:hypothetical protein
MTMIHWLSAMLWRSRFVIVSSLWPFWCGIRDVLTARPVRQPRRLNQTSPLTKHGGIVGEKLTNDPQAGDFSPFRRLWLIGRMDITSNLNL